MNTEPVASYSRTYTLKTKDGKWQWRCEDGTPMSPAFESQVQAQWYQRNMPMLTPAEWMDTPNPSGLVPA